MLLAMLADEGLLEWEEVGVSSSDFGLVVEYLGYSLLNLHRALLECSTFQTSPLVHST